MSLMPTNPARPHDNTIIDPNIDSTTDHAITIDHVMDYVVDHIIIIMISISMTSMA